MGVEARPAQAYDADIALDVITRVLAGQASYDELPEAEQALVRAARDARIAEDVAALDFEAHLSASGKPWYVADADGKVVVRTPKPRFATPAS